MALIWACVGSVATLALSFGVPVATLESGLATRAIFFVLWAHAIFFAHAIYTVAKNEHWRRPKIIADWAPAIGVGLLTATIIYCAVPQQFRVLADETNLIGSSLSLYQGSSYLNVVEGYSYYDQLHPVTTIFDKRPALFSFLLYILHCTLGYDAGHGFLLNFFASALSVALIFRIGAHYDDVACGILSVLSLVGLPIFALSATSSGFEVLNQLLLGATFWQLANFLERATPARLQLLLVTGLAAAEVRYESILVLIPVAVAAILRRRELKSHRDGLPLVLAPLLAVPLIWQRRIFSSLNEGDSESTAPFALDHLRVNVQHLFEYWFDPKFVDYPLSRVIVALALVGSVIVVRNLIARPDRNRTMASALIAVTMFLIVSVQLAYYLGDPRQPAAQRMATTYSGLFALLAAAALRKCLQLPQCAVLTWGLALFFACNGLSRAAADTQGRQLLIARQYRATLDVLQTYPRNGTLLVADRPGMFVVHRYGAISGKRASAEAEALRSAFERRLFGKILVEQRIYYDQSLPPTPEIPLGFSAAVVREYQSDSRYLVRISELTPDADARLQE